MDMLLQLICIVCFAFATRGQEAISKGCFPTIQRIQCPGTDVIYLKEVHTTFTFMCNSEIIDTHCDKNLAPGHPEYDKVYNSCQERRICLYSVPQIQVDRNCGLRFLALTFNYTNFMIITYECHPQGYDFTTEALTTTTLMTTTTVMTTPPPTTTMAPSTTTETLTTTPLPTTTSAPSTTTMSPTATTTPQPTTTTTEPSTTVELTELTTVPSTPLWDILTKLPKNPNVNIVADDTLLNSATEAAATQDDDEADYTSIAIAMAVCAFGLAALTGAAICIKKNKKCGAPLRAINKKISGDKPVHNQPTDSPQIHFPGPPSITTDKGSLLYGSTGYPVSLTDSSQSDLGDSAPAVPPKYFGEEDSAGTLPSSRPMSPKGKKPKVPPKPKNFYIRQMFPITVEDTLRPLKFTGRLPLGEPHTPQAQSKPIEYIYGTTATVLQVNNVSMEGTLKSTKSIPIADKERPSSLAKTGKKQSRVRFETVPAEIGYSDGPAPIDEQDGGQVNGAYEPTIFPNQANRRAAYNNRTPKGDEYSSCHNSDISYGSISSGSSRLDSDSKSPYEVCYPQTPAQESSAAEDKNSIYYSAVPYKEAATVL